MESEEQAVLVHLHLADSGFGDSTDRERIAALEEQLEHATASNDVGEYDGNEIGEGKCILFLYGHDADDLFRSIEPILRDSSLGPGAYAVKRYGEPGSEEVRVELSACSCPDPD